MHEELTVALVGGMLLTLSATICGEVSGRVRAAGGESFCWVFADLHNCRLTGETGEPEMWIGRAVFDLDSADEGRAASAWFARFPRRERAA